MALHILQLLFSGSVGPQIYHTTSIPYNPQGQAIVEGVHAILKMQLKILKGGDEVLPPASQCIKIYIPLIF
jgi:hypothetical protein